MILVGLETMGSHSFFHLAAISLIAPNSMLMSSLLMNRGEIRVRPDAAESSVPRRATRHPPTNNQGYVLEYLAILRTNTKERAHERTASRRLQLQTPAG